MSVLRYCTFEVILAMESQLLSDCNNEMCLHRSALSALQHFQGIEMSSSMSPKTLVGSKCEKNPLRRQKQFPKKKESLSYQLKINKKVSQFSNFIFFNGQKMEY